MKHIAGLVTLAAGVIVAVAVAGAQQAPPAEDLRVVTYNIRHGRGVDEKVDLDRTAGVLRPLRPDLVGLQEVDDRVKRSGSVPEAARLGELLDMHRAFGKFMDFQGGAYGMAILSRRPIDRIERVLLPEGNEPRIALVVQTTLADGRPIAVINVHFDWVKDDGFRFAQAETLNQYLAGLSMPYVLMGDFNDMPGSRTIALFRKGRGEAAKPAGAAFTFPSPEPEREIDYVFFSPASLFTPREVRVIDERVASDHRPVLAVLTPAAKR